MGTRTRWVGVIGAPVAHSRSPAMHNAALAALDLDWAYGAFLVDKHDLAAAIAGARALGFVGLNVTVPHKIEALAWCVPDAVARRTGAVNTLVFTSGLTNGHNTDVYGFRKLLVEAGEEARGKRALVLGAGGAARAVVIALRDLGAHVTVAARSRSLGLGSDEEPPHIDLASARDHLADVNLLIDATPRGLADEPVPEDPALLAPDALVVDLVVRRETPLVAAARRAGVRAVTGTAMLLHQGAAALALWTGREPPLDVMRAALDASL